MYAYHLFRQPDFRGTHVTPAEAERDIRTDRQTGDRQSYPYVTVCFDGTTKMK